MQGQPGPGPYGYGYGPAPAPSSYGDVPVVATRSNVPGMVGFWLAVAGFFTCGVTGIPALVCSIVGAQREPKAWAIGGIFVSIPSVLWSVFWIITWTNALIRAAVE